jgi:lipopolysaccharide assembly outer membrane protein LptD (OstA)
MKKFLFSIILIPAISFGQNAVQSKMLGNIVVNQADNKVDLNDTYILTGQVALQVGNTWLDCDSAVIDRKNLFLSAYGNVKISSSPDVHFYTSYVHMDISDYKGVAFAEPQVSKPINKPAPALYKIRWSE